MTLAFTAAIGGHNEVNKAYNAIRNHDLREEGTGVKTTVILIMVTLLLAAIAGAIGCSQQGPATQPTEPGATQTTATQSGTTQTTATQQSTTQTTATQTTTTQTTTTQTTATKITAAGKLLIGVPNLGSEYPDPNGYMGGTDKQFLNMIFTPLAAIGLNGLADPNRSVASWEMAKDGLSWTFKVHPDMKFQNGDPVLAQDIQFSLERVAGQSSKALSAARMRTIVGSVDILNKYTARVNLKQVVTSFVFADLLSGNPVWIVPKNYVGQVGDSNFRANPCGSGPFKFVELVPADHYEFEAFPDYWLGSPYVKTVRILAVPEDATRLALLKTGAIDIMASVPPQMTAEIKAQSGLRVISSTDTCDMRIFPPRYWEHLDTPWGAALANENVRAALNYGVDRDAILKILFQGQGSPMVTPIHRGALGADPNLKAYAYDTNKAKELLAKAGYPNGLSLTLYTSTATAISGTVEVCEILQKQWADIGVNLNIVQMDYAALRQKVQAKQMDGLWMAATTFLPDALTVVSNMAVSNAPNTALSDPAFDKLYNDAAAELDPSTQIAKMQGLDDYIYNHYVYITLITSNTFFGVAQRVVEWPQTVGWGYLANLELVKLK